MRPVPGHTGDGLAVGARTINWAVETPLIWQEARGSVALFCALVALRKCEAGRAGREFGVLSVPAPTFAEQLAVAARSIRNHAERARVRGVRVLAPTGLYAEDFLRDFSARWAPTRGATNDPTGLNAHHADNLVKLTADVARQLAERAQTITV